jgi:hypothetical protein
MFGDSRRVGVGVQKLLLDNVSTISMFFFYFMIDDAVPPDVPPRNTYVHGLFE